ncbi:hypothetical protein [Streptomyces sp. NPDC057496]|uniref:hypothetical protein n=1 Tax=Streptomyces sp. NPDC057496 TaxID=3346149 RepID=UPI00367CCEE4
MPLSRMIFSSGRPIGLTELRMSSACGKMPAGYPRKPVNDMKARSLQQQAERAFPSTPVHPVPPSRTYPDRTAGAFRSTAAVPGLDPVLHRSALTVVRFRTVLTVPSDKDASLALRSVRREEPAKDHDLWRRAPIAAAPRQQR